MGMVTWARGKTKKDHIKNEEIWREANIEPMTHKLHTTEMRMLRWAGGKTKKDHIKNEEIWREADTTMNQWQPSSERDDNMLSKEEEDTAKKMLNMQVQGERRREEAKEKLAR